MAKVFITIPGEPRGWGRPTPVARLRSDGTPFVMMVTQDETRAAKKRVLAAFRQKYPDHRPWTGPVMLRFTAIFSTPKTFNKALQEAAARGDLYCVRKPDTDNIAKLIKDALNGHVYADDQQVMGGGVKKYGAIPRVEIHFETLDSPAVPATPGQKRAEKALAAGPFARRTGGNVAKPPKSVPVTAQPTLDLGGYSDRQRDLIERAIARDEAAQQERRRGK